MSYVPNYQNDIFVSYAHVDDLPIIGADKGWVSTLVGCIKTKLAQRLGRSDAYSLWMDYELEKHVNLTPQIMDALRNTAIMIVILSPGYLKSPWCEREKNTFLELIKDSASRVFIIERDMVDPSARPSEFHDLQGFKFWVPDCEGKPPRILGEPEPSKYDRDYYTMVDSIVHELEKELDSLCKTYQKETEPIADDQPIVFLSECTDDLEQNRTNFKNYLGQFGINVLPNTWYSQEPNQFAMSVERDLAKCEAFVQLLSSSPGKKPPDLPKGYLQLQLEIAKAAGKQIFQWRNPALDVPSIQDKNHRALVDGPQVRAESIEDFKRAIKDFVLVKPEPEKKFPISAFVFVNMETADRPLAEKICSVLDEYGIGYSLPLGEGDPTDMRNDLERNLSESNGIIIVYGSSTVAWVRHQLMECNKALALRKRPLQAFAVFEGPHDQVCQIGIKLPNLQFLNFRDGCDNAFLKEELKAFIDRIGKEEL